MVQRPPGAGSRRPAVPPRSRRARRPRRRPAPSAGEGGARPDRRPRVDPAQPLPEHRGPGRGARPRDRRGARHHRRLRAARRAGRALHASAGHRRLGDRGAARPAVPSLRGRRRRQGRGRDDRAADLPEPGRDRGRPGDLRAVGARPADGRGDPPSRAADPLLRPVHLVRDPFPGPQRRRRRA